MVWAFFLLAAWESDTAFNEALKTRFSAGYEAQLAFSLSAVKQVLGEAPSDDVLRMRYGRMLRDAAPNAEGSAGFFAALSKRAASNEDKRFFTDAAQRARANDVKAPLVSRTTWSLLAFLALAFGGCAWFLVRPIWSAVPRYWLTLYVLALASTAWAVTSELRTLARASAMAPALFSGYLADARADLAEEEGMIQGLARAYAGETDVAERIFARLPESADTLANRGVLALRSGDRQGARALFMKALERSPDHVAASYGLWRAIGELPPKSVSDDFRFQHAIRFNAPALYAMPSPSDWERELERAPEGDPIALLPLPLTLVGVLCALIAITAGALARKRVDNATLRLTSELLVPGATLPFGLIVTTSVAFLALAPWVALRHPDYGAFYLEHLDTPLPLWLSQPWFPLALVWIVALIIAVRRFRRGS